MTYMFEGEKKLEILLWHRRLGHASFGYLKKKVVPSLFINCDVSSLHYDVCELEKSHRTHFY